MRFVNRAAFVSAFVATLVACSDGDSPPAKQAYVPPDAAVTIPAQAAALPPITVIVKGDGEIEANDGTIDCHLGDTGAKCTSSHTDVMLTAVGNLPWVFDHWEPTMSTAATLHLDSWTVSPLTAVFTPTKLLDGGGVGD